MANAQDFNRVSSVHKKPDRYSKKEDVKLKIANNVTMVGLGGSSISYITIMREIEVCERKSFNLEEQMIDLES